MKFDVPESIIRLLKTLEDKKFEAYVVGGAVRDLIGKKIVYDWDFTTDATPKEILKLFKDADAYYTNEFGTVGIPNQVEGERPYEITTFRTEHGYSDARRPDKVKWGKSLEEDLKRRDFTINAMALKLANGKQTTDYRKKQGVKTVVRSPKAVDYQLIDPHHGQKDLDEKLIRAVGDPSKRFSEDALRMMRAVRFAAELNFEIEKKTKGAIYKNKKLIHKIAAERVKDELFKLLASVHPYEGVIAMREVGLLEELLPELEKTFGVEQKSPGRHHVHDVGTHSFLSLKFCKSTDPLVRFATLIHDVGKPQTFKKLKTGTITFYNHEMVSARIAKDISRRLRFSNKEKDRFWKLVRYHQFTVDENQTDSAIRRFIRKVGIENVEDMLDLRVGDRLGGGARETSWRLEEFKKRLVEVQKQPFTVRDLKISGNDVMKELNLKPSPKVGEILQKLYDEVVKKKVVNEKKELLKRLKKN